VVDVLVDTPWRTALVIVALAAAPGAGAKPAFSGNVCALVPGKQVTVLGASSKCTNARPSKGPGSTIYVGNWAGATANSPTVQVTIAVYSDDGMLQLADRNLKQGLPGAPKKVAGIGDAAYEAKGALSVGIHLAVGKDIAYISLNSVKTPPKSPALIEPLAKTVAAHL